MYKSKILQTSFLIGLLATLGSRECNSAPSCDDICQAAFDAGFTLVDTTWTKSTQELKERQPTRTTQPEKQAFLAEWTKYIVAKRRADHAIDEGLDACKKACSLPYPLQK